MKVLVVNTVPYCRNGIAGVIFNIYKQLEKQNVQMDFVATDHATEPWARELIKKYQSQLYEIDKSYSHIWSYVCSLARCAKGYDVIHVHGNSSSMVFELLAARLAGVKKCIAHSHNTTCKSPYLDKLLRPFFYMLCNGRLACGEDAGKWMFKNRKFTVINNGIDTEAYRFNDNAREVERKRLGLTDEVLIGHIGRLNEQKNQIFLLKVFERLVTSSSKEFRLILIGDGPLEESLKRKVIELKIEDKVFFAGSINNVDSVINAIDLIVMPSLYEGLPLTLVEEQANGLVCIVSDTITKEADLSGNLFFVPLEAGEDEWKNKIESVSSCVSRIETSNISIQTIKEKGFDVCTSCMRLLDIYGLGSRE